MSISQTISKSLLKAFGWKAYSKIEIPKKCVICIAPHTSNWDFWIGKLGYAAIGGVKPNFMIKQEWFRFPFNLFFGPIGGIPINRKGSHSMTEATIEKAKECEKLQLGITPEGTRKAMPKWKHGFYYIAKGAAIPIVIAALDYKRKEVYLDHIFEPTDDAKADLWAIKNWYKDHDIEGCHPEKFAIGNENNED